MVTHFTDSDSNAEKAKLRGQTLGPLLPFSGDSWGIYREGAFGKIEEQCNVKRGEYVCSIFPPSHCSLTYGPFHLAQAKVRKTMNEKQKE